MNKKAKRLFSLAALLSFFYGIAVLSSGTQLLILLLPIISAYLFTSRLLGKNSNLIDKINILFLVLCCFVILMTEILSLLRSISSSGFLLASTLLFLACLAYCPSLKSHAKADYEQFCGYQSRFRLLLKENKAAALFFYVFLASLLWRIFLVLYVPPNNWDSMAYHLSKVAYWIQNHSLMQFDTHYWAQKIHPFNAEILLLWTMAASRTDSFCGFIQLICYGLSGTLIYQCVRHFLKASLLTSLAVVFVWYSLPEAVLQSTSTQNDLVLSYFILFSLVYFLLGALPKGRESVSLIRVSAVAFGLAVGVKTSVFFYAVPFILGFFIWVLRKRLSAKTLWVWAAAGVTSWLLFGAYNYIQNYIHSHHLLGPKHFIDIYKAQGLSLKGACSNFFQHGYALGVNQTGLQLYLGQWFSKIYNLFTGRAGETLFWLLQIPTNIPGHFVGRPFSFYDWPSKFAINEDTAFFGLAGPLLMMLAVWAISKALMACWVKQKQYDLRDLPFAFLFLGYLGCLSCLMKWQLWSGRYILNAVIVGMPLLTRVFENKTAFTRIAGKGLLIYCLLLLLPSTLMNELKPVNALNRDRMGLRCMIRPSMAEVFRKFDRLTSELPHCRVGIFFTGSHWDYPLFGDKLQRTVVPIDLEKLRRQNFDFFLVSERELEKNQALKIAVNERYTLLENLGSHKEQDWQSFKDSDWLLFKLRPLR